MSTSYELDEVDAFVVDAVGVPGARTFFFRARVGSEMLTFKCEKVQAQALAEAIRSKTPALVGAEDGFWSVLTGLAAHRSIDEGRVVELRELL